MNCIMMLLRKIGLLAHVSHSAIEEAEKDNVEFNMIEHDKAMVRLTESATRGSQSNGKLRESIQRIRASQFADLEVLMHHADGSNRRAGH